MAQRSKVITAGSAAAAGIDRLDQILFGLDNVTDKVLNGAQSGQITGRSITIPAGNTVTPAADRPLILRARKRITIGGTINAKGVCLTRTGQRYLGTCTFSTGGGGGGGGASAAGGTDGASSPPTQQAWVDFGNSIAPPPTNGYTIPVPGNLAPGGVHGAVPTAGDPGSAGVNGALQAQVADIFAAFPLIEPPAGAGPGAYGLPGGAGGDADTGGAKGGAGGAGGTSGHGGGVVVLIAPEIVFEATSVIDCDGDDGGVGAVGTAGGAGVAGGDDGGGGGGGGAGGGGGNGGAVLMYYRTITVDPAALLNFAGGKGGLGGLGGLGGAGNVAGVTGGAGGGGATGPDGADGFAVPIQILS